MLKMEAKQALDEGKRISHQYFAPMEFIYLEDGHIKDECGNILHDFWLYRQANTWDNGWCIYTDNLDFL